MMRIVLLVLCLHICIAIKSYGQLIKPVQVTGLVVTGEHAIGIPGAYFYIPKTSRGVQTNEYGYFSIAARPGDTAVISDIGFKKQLYIIPSSKTQSISVIIHLEADTSMLPFVEVMPFPTEAIFKEAFLSLRLNESEFNNMRRNLAPHTVALMQAGIGMDAGSNNKTYTQKQIDWQNNQRFAPVVQLTNPFAWAKFIKSVRKGKELNKKE